jgi:triosephosphate isomerase
LARKILVAGNWKLNGSLAMTEDLILAIKSGLPTDKKYDVALFPPHVYLTKAVEFASDEMLIGAQALSSFQQGAYTGEVSAEMLVDVGCKMVLVGHSERRSLFSESNQEVAVKFEKAINAGLTPILCCGETLAERNADITELVVAKQINTVIEKVGIEKFKNAIIAYEPVWAIGTGMTASAQQAQKVHEFIRSLLAQNDDTIAPLVPVLYGGSVKGCNAKELFSMQDIDGGLIGGASLTSENFLAICQQAEISS